MKTKLFILFAAIAFTFGTANVYAEGGDAEVSTGNGSNTGIVNLKIEMYPIQSLVINSLSKDVTLKYQTKENYSAGVSVKAADHINVYSTGGFEITANAKAANFEPSIDEENIATSDILLTPTKGTTKGLESATTTAKKLDGTTLVSLISSEIGGVDINFDMTYKAAGGNKYINYYKHEDGKAATVYTTEVTYTIVAK